MKKVLLLLFSFFALFSVSFAVSGIKDWQLITSLAIMVSGTVLAGIYMAGHAFNIDELKFLAKEEFFQLIFTVLIVGGFVGFAEYSSQLSDALGGTKSLQDVALDRISDSSNQLGSAFGVVKDISDTLSSTASKSGSCSFISIGVSVAGCGGHRTAAAPLPMALQAISLSMMEFGSLDFLVNIGKNFAVFVFLPIGVFLRTFKLSRGAGGFFIALAIAFYFILPLSILFMDSIVQDFYKSHADYKTPGKISFDAGSVKCDPFEPVSIIGSHTYENANNVLDKIIGDIKSYVFAVLIGATLTTVVSILIMILAIRRLTSLGGAEIDISTLARIA